MNIHSSGQLNGLYMFQNVCFARFHPIKLNGSGKKVLIKIYVILLYFIIPLLYSGAPAREARQRSTMGKKFW